MYETDRLGSSGLVNVCITDPGQQPYGLQEALSVGRVEDPDLQQVLVFHHIAALQSKKTTTATVRIYAAFLHPERKMQQCLQLFSIAPHKITFRDSSLAEKYNTVAVKTKQQQLAFQGYYLFSTCSPVVKICGVSSLFGAFIHLKRNNVFAGCSSFTLNCAFFLFLLTIYYTFRCFFYHFMSPLFSTYHHTVWKSSHRLLNITGGV